VTPDGFRALGRTYGLAAGLAAVLDGFDTAVAAPQGVAVLPAAGLPHGACVVPHPFAAREGLAVVRFPPQSPNGRIGWGLTKARAVALAAVRLGVLEGLLDTAITRLAGRTFGGVPLIEKQLVVGAIADVLTELELSAAHCAEDAPAETAAAQHERLTEAGWTVTRFFGAEGYLADHPVRGLYLSALVADVWVPRPMDTYPGE
jgi:hypothetical protein